MEHAEIYFLLDSEEALLMDPRSAEGQAILQKITQYLSLPTASSPAQIWARLGGSDGDMQIDLNTDFIRPPPSWGPGYEHRLLATPASRQARIAFQELVYSIRWAKEDFVGADQLIITAAEERWLENQLQWREPTSRKARWVRKVSRLGEVVQVEREQRSFLSWLLGFEG